jgi:hypothetical protein
MTQTPNNSWDAMDPEDIQLRPDVRYENQIRSEAIEAEQAELAEESQPGPPSAEVTQQPTKSPAAAEATKEEVKATETSPEEKAEKGFWDLSGLGQGLTYMGQPLEETNDQVKQRLSAPGQGIIDFGVDLINMIPGVNVPKVGKYEDDLAQATRQISSVVLPTMAGTGAIRAAGAAGHARVGAGIGNLKSVQWLGNTGAAAGASVAVGAISSEYTGDNAVGTLKKNFPAVGDFIPDTLATLDSDSEDEKRLKNIKEDLYGGIFIDTLGPALKLAKGLFSTRQFIEPGVISAVPRLVGETPGAQSWVDINTPRDVNFDPETDFLANLSRREESLDELGGYNLSLDPSMSVPLKGVHDMFEYGELGMRQVDNFGIVGAGVDAARISKNLDTVNGRLANFISEPALSYSLTDVGNMGDISLGLAKELQVAGPVGQVGRNWTVSFQDTLDATMDITQDLFDPRMSRADIARIVEPLTTVNSSGVQVLSEEGFGMVTKALKGFGEEITALNYTRAESLLAGSLSGRVSDLSEGIRLADGSVAVEAAQDKVIDLMKYLYQVQGSATFYKHRKANLLEQIQNGFTNITGYNAATVDQANDVAKGIFRRSEYFGDSLKALAQSDPNTMKSLLLAYEMTDGRISSINTLNEYIFDLTGNLGKGLIDMNPETKNLLISGVWNNMYNSILSAFKTPISALTGNASNMILKPMTHFAGALVHGDRKAMTRNWIAYSSIGDSFNKAWSYSGDVFKKASQDPNSVASVTRTDLLLKQEKELEFLQTLANSKMAEGDEGLAYVVRNLEMMNGMAKDPVLRLGSNGLIATDGLSGSMVANAESYFRAMDELADSGVEITKDSVKAISDKYYAKMFNKKGLISDEAVKWTNNEMALNLDSPLIGGMTGLTDRLPILKPFLMFPTTGGNRIALLSKYAPYSPFIREVNQLANTPLKQILGNAEFIDNVLIGRGIDISTMSDLAKQNRITDIKYEVLGRKMIGMSAVTGAVSLMMNDRLTGAKGLVDQRAQQARVSNSNWKPKMIKGLDGKWYSYESMGVLGDWLAMTADVMDNVTSLGGLQVEEFLPLMATLLAANVTDQTGLSSIKPLVDMTSGGKGFERWAAGFVNGLGPLAGARAEWSRVFSDGLRIVNGDLVSQLENRNRFASELNGEANQAYIYSPVTGKKKNSYSFLQRLWNATNIMQIHDAPNPEEEFLSTWEFDVGTTFKTIDGVEVPPKIQSHLLKTMGEEGIFRKGIKEVMRWSKDAKAIGSYEEIKATGSQPAINEWLSIHKRLKTAQALAKDSAIMALPPAMKAELDYAAAQQRETAMAAQQGREAVELQRK